MNSHTQFYFRGSYHHYYAILCHYISNIFGCLLQAGRQMEQTANCANGKSTA